MGPVEPADLAAGLLAGSALYRESCWKGTGAVTSGPREAFGLVLSRLAQTPPGSLVGRFAAGRPTTSPPRNLEADLDSFANPH